MTVVLLTGTVVPNVMDNLVVFQPEVRKNQYLSAIRWYVKNTDYRIVFCENSGTDISPLLNEEEKERVEVLTFAQPQITDPTKDRGYTEMLIIEYALQHSLYLSNADLVVKGTGRLILKNIKSLVGMCKGRRLFVSTWMVYGCLYAESRFFLCCVEWLRYFVGYKDKVCVNCNFEATLAQTVRCSVNEAGFHFHYPIVRPWINGVGGGSGVQYELPLWKWFLSSLRLLPLALMYNWGGYMPNNIQVVKD